MLCSASASPTNSSATSSFYSSPSINGFHLFHPQFKLIKTSPRGVHKISGAGDKPGSSKSIFFPLKLWTINISQQEFGCGEREFPAGCWSLLVPIPLLGFLLLPVWIGGFIPGFIPRFIPGKAREGRRGRSCGGKGWRIPNPGGAAASPRPG